MKNEKRKTTNKITAIILITILTISTITILPVLANTIDSSVMHFEGSLTDAGSGVYTGTIAATAGEYYIPGGPGTTYVTDHYETPDGRLAVGGFDVYAKVGGTAYFDYLVSGTIGSNHDAYTIGGGWGDFWDPDVPDWDNYQLTLTSTHWYLEYKGENLGTPMSGTIDWDNMYAYETDVGSYRGTVPGDEDANDGDAAANGGGPQAWDMDWTWGSEAIPLEFPGFNIEISDLGSGDYHVTFTPAKFSNDVSLDAVVSGYILTINTVGMGTVAPSLPGPYPHNTLVELTASAAENWQFSGWSGDLTSFDNPDEITLDGHKTVTATFEMDVISIDVNPNSINFDPAIMGTIAGPETVNIDNTGNVDVMVTASVDPGFFGSYLRIDTDPVGDWDKTILEGSSIGASLTLDLTTVTSISYESGTLVFWAEEYSP